jgi:hypothetical protein
MAITSKSETETQTAPIEEMLPQPSNVPAPTLAPLELQVPTTVEFQIARFSILETAPSEAGFYPIPTTAVRISAPILEKADLMFSILTRSSPFETPVPIPVTPISVTVAFRMKSEKHELPPPTPIPGPFSPPSARTTPSALVPIVRFDPMHSSAASKADERNKFDPSKTRGTSLSSTNRGESPSTATPENRNRGIVDRDSRIRPTAYDRYRAETGEIGVNAVAKRHVVRADFEAAIA